MWQFSVTREGPTTEKSVAWTTVLGPPNRSVPKLTVVCEDCLPQFKSDYEYGHTIVCIGKIGYVAEPTLVIGEC